MILISVDATSFTGNITNKCCYCHCQLLFSLRSYLDANVIPTWALKTFGDGDTVILKAIMRYMFTGTTAIVRGAGTGLVS